MGNIDASTGYVTRATDGQTRSTCQTCGGAAMAYSTFGDVDAEVSCSACRNTVAWEGMSDAAFAVSAATMPGLPANYLPALEQVAEELGIVRYFDADDDVKQPGKPWAHLPVSVEVLRAAVNDAAKAHSAKMRADWQNAQAKADEHGARVAQAGRVQLGV